MTKMDDLPALTRRRFGLLALSLPFWSPAQAASDLMTSLLRQAGTPRHSRELWVLVEDREASLSIFRGEAMIDRFSPISLGRGGAKPQRVRGDRVTPLGEFRVMRFNHASKYHIFVGLDYPTPTHARMALESGVYSQQDYDDYFAHYRRHGEPPQETALGGYIGIHGVGVGDPEIHRRFHWTNGCVAVTDAQVEALSSMIDIGTRVVIR
ncbi:murein L,D-transpeptidase family protein [Halomonas beimenensis]|uniref:ErfK/YbiS/YcfS/YnhG n=1 Tax=Halomonas beimenensis TaxID=475662 RepID=A0A291P8G8_9GAMM|nr:L,D-transpeptidase [Halomonas beimenensis]ATJ83174.1 ErfK/YbiS/YcfS/YnhG [Halomonas beimenensis]